MAAVEAMKQCAWEFFNTICIKTIYAEEFFVHEFFMKNVIIFRTEGLRGIFNIHAITFHMKGKFLPYIRFQIALKMH
jgi:hypothetical protein